MAKKQVTFFSAVLVPLITIGLTVGLFFLLVPEEKHEDLFYFNLGYACFLELIFFGYFNFIRTDKNNVSGAMYSIMGPFALYYIIAGLVIMLIYTLLLSNVMAMKYYISILSVLTVLWLIVGGLLAETDVKHKANTDRIMIDKNTINIFRSRSLTLANHYESLSKEKNIVYKDESANRSDINRLTNAFQSITPNVLRNPDTVNQLQTILDKAETLVDKFENSTDETNAAVVNEVKKFVDASIKEIEFLKTTNRS